MWRENEVTLSMHVFLRTKTNLDYLRGLGPFIVEECFVQNNTIFQFLCRFVLRFTVLTFLVVFRKRVNAKSVPGFSPAVESPESYVQWEVFPLFPSFFLFKKNREVRKKKVTRQ